jgi:hypothetical protein
MSVLARNEIIFVLNNLSDWQTLVAGLPTGAEVHVLDAKGDALKQMASLLEGRTGLDAIHLLSHGSDGTLQLGAFTLTATILSSYAYDLARIGQALNADGDMLLYGCNLAQSPTGKALVTDIARLTQADLAASVDTTGVGGNLKLEFSTGPVDSAVLTQAFTSYPHALAYTPGDAVIDLGVSGKLILPIHVEGKWYYYWDLNGDGIRSALDKVNHDVLDGIFNGGSDTTTTMRNGTINGVSVALPTVGGITGEFKAGTVVGGNGSNFPNPIYDDLSAIWDAYNGASTSYNINGTPPGWPVNDFLGQPTCLNLRRISLSIYRLAVSVPALTPITIITSRCR